MAKQSLLEILSPATLSKIENYQIIARIVVDGVISGMHRSVYHGFGSEFLQYRSYSPGDDLKYIDWKAFGRLDRFLTKVFQEETNFNIAIIVDASASMAYQGASSPCSKFRLAMIIAASLAYLASRQGDNVGLLAYSDEIKSFVSPSRREGHLSRIINEISRLVPSGRAAHSSAMKFAAESFRRRGMVVLISDFLETEVDMHAILKDLRTTRNDCIVFQVLDPDEKNFPFKGAVNFIDSENGSEISTAPENVRNDYLASIQTHVAGIRQACLELQSDYISVDSSEDIGHIITGYLERRGGIF